MCPPAVALYAVTPVYEIGNIYMHRCSTTMFMVAFMNAELLLRNCMHVHFYDVEIIPSNMMTRRAFSLKGYTAEVLVCHVTMA